MTRIFNVAYVEHDRKDTAYQRRSSAVLIDQHPLVWAMNPPADYSKHFFTTIDSWTEVAPEDVPMLLKHFETQNVLNVEDYRPLSEGKAWSKTP